MSFEQLKWTYRAWRYRQWLERGEIRLLKYDAEGHELEVFRGGLRR